MYHEIVLNSLAYLGFSSMREIEKMTLNEYLIRTEAFQLQTIKRNEELAYQAWLNQQVQATTGSSKNPKPKFKEFRKFFDSEKLIDEVRSSFELDYITTSNKAKLRTNENVFAQRLKEFKELKKQGKIIPWNERTQEERGGF
ncbi:hypothetical protein SN811_01130 [Ligilactobacillus agilis]|uniref:Uncharacterized protein n=2 Tax=Ligilactobacillus agilis TaxID=1601 RepID=A0A6F9Y230_9LACO|nr:hypothetical protein SN811_01130 [Ligilactobacillus agilis]